MLARYADRRAISPLVAFNVFTAFSIDVFCQIQDDQNSTSEPGEVERNLDKIGLVLAQEGKILHIGLSRQLQQSRVYMELFDDLNEDEGLPTAAPEEVHA